MSAKLALIEIVRKYKILQTKETEVCVCCVCVCLCVCMGV